jgi:hypothetical protein
MVSILPGNDQGNLPPPAVTLYRLAVSGYRVSNPDAGIMVSMTVYDPRTDPEVVELLFKLYLRVLEFADRTNFNLEYHHHCGECQTFEEFGDVGRMLWLLHQHVPWFDPKEVERDMKTALNHFPPRTPYAFEIQREITFGDEP